VAGTPTTRLVSHVCHPHGRNINGHLRSLEVVAAAAAAVAAAAAAAAVAVAMVLGVAAMVGPILCRMFKLVCSPNRAVLVVPVAPAVVTEHRVG
jgi:hypothetical protein